MQNKTDDAAFLIESLRLQAHPEGGWFREIYRSDENVAQAALPPRYSGDRSFGTSIYYLLKGNDISAFHRLHSDEIWHFYAGSAVMLWLLTEDGTLTKRILGNNFRAGEELQVIMPRNTWFAAEVIDKASFALTGCSVYPGFSFSDFIIAKKAALLAKYPACRDVIERLARD